METIKCGTLVVIKLANIKGMITCMNLRFDRVSYEVSYYDGLDAKSIWAHESEFEVVNPETTKIGFKKL